MTGNPPFEEVGAEKTGGGAGGFEDSPRFAGLLALQPTDRPSCRPAKDTSVACAPGAGERPGHQWLGRLPPFSPRDLRRTQVRGTIRIEVHD